LGRGLDVLRTFDSFDRGEEVGNRTGAANSGKEGGSGESWLSLNCLGVEAAVVLDLEFAAGYLAVVDSDFQGGGAFDFGDLVEYNFVHGI
jgi:hypothetical protein